MGEYAEIAIDRELDGFLSGKYEDDNLSFNSSLRPCRVDEFDIIRDSGEIGLLFRNFKVSLNMTILFVRETNHAFLFRINDECYKHDGKCFWCPKSILHRKDDEKKVFYIPNWSKLTIVNRNDYE